MNKKKEFANPSAPRPAIRRTNSIQLCNKTINQNVTGPKSPARSFNNSPRRKLINRDVTLPTASSRMGSNLSSHLSMSVPNLRASELENEVLEMELHFSHYIAEVAEVILTRQELKKAESNNIKSIKGNHEQTKKLEKTCHFMEKRIIDFKYLTALFDSIEFQLEKLQSFKQILERYKTFKILDNLGIALKKFDVLRSQNIILPKDAETAKEFENIMVNCLVILEQMMSDKKCCNEFDELRKNYEDFVSLYEELRELRQILEEKVGNLQIKSLKSMALS